MAKVTTVCYGKEDNWKTRKSAMKFFMEAAAGTEGSERDRYITILEKLIAGMNYCTDSWDD